jgi:hypothetical protein
MIRSRLPLPIASAALAFVLCSCSGSPPPIPVLGSPEAVSALEGTWIGEYSSSMTQRHGDISFSLTARADTAHGDVLMQPKRAVHGGATGETAPRADDSSPQGLAAQSLRVAFVRALGDSVYGRLDPYLDPDCACRLDTRFAGTLRGDVIEGRYESRRESTGEIVSGTWRLRREK